MNLLNLSECTFTIPVKFDHTDRLENLDGVSRWIRANFKTSIIVMESGNAVDPGMMYFKEVCAAHGAKYVFTHEEGQFHRTAHLNAMARMAITPIVINYDADIVIDPPDALLAGQDAILNGRADFVWPFDSKNHCVVRGHMLDSFLKTSDVAHLKAAPKRLAGIAPGGVIMCNRQKFFEAGGENQHMISWGPEDQERRVRWYELGYNLLRLPGTMYHLEHYRGPASSRMHEHYAGNVAEFERIKTMSAEQLREYVGTWGWAK